MVACPPAPSESLPQNEEEGQASRQASKGVSEKGGGYDLWQLYSSWRENNSCCSVLSSLFGEIMLSATGYFLVFGAGDGDHVNGSAVVKM